MECHIQPSAVDVDFWKEFVQTALQYLGKPVSARLEANKVRVIEIMVFEQLVCQPVNNTLEKRFIHEDL